MSTVYLGKANRDFHGGMIMKVLREELLKPEHCAAQS